MGVSPHDDPFDAFVADVDEEVHELDALIQKTIASWPKPWELTIDEYRAFSEASRPHVTVPEARERTIAGPAGEIGVRVFVPPEVDAVTVYFHGGGWVGGTRDGQDPLLWDLARAANTVVVSSSYRLAPEHPYPAGPDDCEAAALWMLDHAKKEWGTDRCAISGASAGAYMAAHTLVRLRDRFGDTGFRAADLTYGAYDLRMTPSARHASDNFLSTRALEWFFDQFVPDGARRADAPVSPLLADLSGLPPAIFTCGTGDSVVDDTLFMWARWRAAGNEAVLRLYPGAPHAFDATPIALARAARDEIADFLRAHL